MGVGNLGGNGCSAASTSTLAIFLIEIVPRHKATTLMPVIQRVKKHYFVTSMIDHETVNYSQQSALRQPGDWCPHQNGTIQARWSAYKATLTRRIRIQSDVPTSAVVRGWVHMAKKATWRGRHVCGFFGLLSPSPSRNPEIDNKQTEVRFVDVDYVRWNCK